MVRLLSRLARFLLLAFIVISCSRDEEVSVIGSWFYVDPTDSTYNEIYFTKELMLYNLSTSEIKRVYFYKIRNDSLFISFDNFKSIEEFLFNVKSNENIVLIGQYGDELLLNRLEHNAKVFDGLTISNEKKRQLSLEILDRSSAYYGTDLEIKDFEKDTVDIIEF